MANDIKVNFTEEEIEEYINDLNKAKGNNRKINKLLDLSHLPILVAYLRKIGVSEELLSLAAVVEFTRYKMKDVLTSPSIKNWNVTDTGVEFEKHDKFPHPEKIGVDSENTFWLGNDKFFGRKYKEIEGIKWPVNAYMYLKRKMYYYRDIDRPINRWGFAFCRFYYNGEYSIHDRIIRQENGMTYYTTNMTDVGGSEFESKRIYAGEPIDLPETENTLKENYEMYSTLFPKYKEWLDAEYKDKLADRIRVVDSEIYKSRIMKLSGRNSVFISTVKEEFEKYKGNTKKLEELEDYLNSFECGTEEGTSVVESIKTDVNNRLTVDEEFVESVIDSANSEDGNVRVNDLSYEELKVRAEKLTDNADKIEDLMELLRKVNISNDILIENIKKKIKEIGMKKEENAKALVECGQDR